MAKGLMVICLLLAGASFSEADWKDLFDGLLSCVQAGVTCRGKDVNVSCCNGMICSLETSECEFAYGPPAKTPPTPAPRSTPKPTPPPRSTPKPTPPPRSTPKPATEPSKPTPPSRPPRRPKNPSPK